MSEWQTICGVVESADFGMKENFVTITFRVHRDTRIWPGQWTLQPNDSPRPDWSYERGKRPPAPPDTRKE